MSTCGNQYTERWQGLNVVFDVMKSDSAVIIDHFVVPLPWEPHRSAVDLDVMFSRWVAGQSEVMSSCCVESMVVVMQDHL